MKRIVVLCLSLIAVLALTTVAQADVITSPVIITLHLAYMYWPVILVVVLAVVTLLMLRKFRKKR